MQTQRGLRLIKNDVRSRGLRVHLTERGQVVKYPEGAPVRRYHQIVVFHYQIVNWGDGQIQLQRLPVRAVIERNEDSEICSCVEQTFTLGILAHRVHVRAIGNSAHDRGPTFS